MDTRSGLLRYGFVALAWIAGVEWLFGRAVSRLAASPALDGLPRTIIELLGGIGLFLLAPASLLALSLLLLSVSSAGAVALAVQDRWRLALATYVGLFAVVSGAFVFMPRESWLSIAYPLMAVLAFWWIAIQYFAQKDDPLQLRIGVLLITCAYAGYLTNLLIQELEPAGLALGVSPIVIRDLGEAFLVAVPFVFFASVVVPFRQWLKPSRWIVPLILAAAFSAANIADMLADQGFTGVFAIWSIGLSYFLPWPLYAISLVLYTYSILTCLSEEEHKSLFATKDRAIGLLLLTFASYELQFPYQYILALLSLMLLSGMIAPFGIGSRSVPKLASTQDEVTFGGGELVSQSQSKSPNVTT